MPMIAARMAAVAPGESAPHPWREADQCGEPRDAVPAAGLPAKGGRHFHM
jgi:hypothetical protein